MSHAIPPDDCFHVEGAIAFLLDEYGKTGHNSKPTILHSIRVGVHLLELGYDTPTIIVAILHDLLEDTSVTFSEIERRFGKEIACNVAAVSFDRTIVDFEKQYSEMFSRTLRCGRRAVVVKAADLNNNSLYYGLIPERRKQVQLVGMVECFLSMTALYSTEPIMTILRNSHQRELSRLAVKN